MHRANVSVKKSIEYFSQKSINVTVILMKTSFLPPVVIGSSCTSFKQCSAGVPNSYCDLEVRKCRCRFGYFERKNALGQLVCEKGAYLYLMYTELNDKKYVIIVIIIGKYRVFFCL